MRRSKRWFVLLFIHCKKVTNKHLHCFYIISLSFWFTCSKWSTNFCIIYNLKFLVGYATTYVLKLQIFFGQSKNRNGQDLCYRHVDSAPVNLINGFNSWTVMNVGVHYHAITKFCSTIGLNICLNLYFYYL